MTLAPDSTLNGKAIANKAIAAPASPGMAPSDSFAAGLMDWLNQGPGPDPGQGFVPVTPEAAIAELRLLRFQLQGNETALLPLGSIQEVLQVPKQGLLRVPGMATSVLGVASSRGAILWMVDLALLLGLEASPKAAIAPQPWQPLNRSQQSLSTITIQAAGESLGLVVPQVMDIETHAATLIQPPSADLFSSQLMPFLEGYLTRSCSPVLSASALIEHLQLQRQP
jgi:positive phototaxis protein PixI